jgi:hypothetical protein
MFATTAPASEPSIDGLISSLTTQVRRRVQKINLDKMASEEKLSRIDIVNAFNCVERPRGSKEVKQKHKECLTVFQNWYNNFIPKDKVGGKSIKARRHEINTRIKSNPAEYFESTLGFKNRMRSFIANPGSTAIKSVAIKLLAKGYPK